jgi:Transposase
MVEGTPSHPTLYATGLVDVDARIVIDLVEGNSATDLRRWCAEQDVAWLAGVQVVTTDLAESYRAGLDPHLAHARRVADSFHVVRVGNRRVDKVRRPVQNETLGHRGRQGDPCIGSASCCSPGPNASTSAATTGCCWACASVTPTTRSSAPAGQGVGARHLPHRRPRRARPARGHVAVSTGLSGRGGHPLTESIG